jgi:uncharacterized membrane protein (UPF0127 family)
MPIMLLAGLSIWICGAPPVNKPAFAQSAAGSPQILEAESLFIVTSRGRFEIRAEIADNPDEQAKGLMFRDELAANEGMLFDFGARRMVTMWMKNTPLSLDMVFIRADGTVARVAERTVPNSLDTISSGEPVSFVLEIPGGVSKMLGIRPGDRLEHRLFTK